MVSQDRATKIAAAALGRNEPDTSTLTRVAVVPVAVGVAAMIYGDPVPDF